MDAFRKGDEFHVGFDLPGVEASSIELTMEKNVLTLRAERHWRGDGAETLVCERPQGTFTRQLFLGESLDADHIEASYQNGVLWLRIPVLESAKPRQVPVNATDKAEAITTATA
jgi:HSP20 family protein